MIFDVLVVGPLGVNCFILGCDQSREAMVVDPGGDAERVLARVRELNLAVKAVVNTHGHFDHVGGNAAVVAATHAELLVHREDVPMLLRAGATATMYGMNAQNSPEPDRYLEDGLIITFGNCSCRVIHTPGHTQGGCCLYFADSGKVITGDTLFAESIGRTDLPGGSHQQLLRSIREKLFVLPEEVEAYPGHGPSTTIGHEKRDNPYVGEEA